MDIRLFIKNW